MAKLFKVFTFLIVFGSLFGTASVKAAQIQLSSPATSLIVGDKLVIEVILKPEPGESVNAFDVFIGLPAGLTTLVSLAAEEADIVWLTRPSYDAVVGALHLSGGLFKPVNEPFLAAKFLLTAENEFTGGELRVKTGPTKILAADGRGTALPVKAAPLRINRAAGQTPDIKIISPTHPLEQKWYPSRELKLNWPAAAGEAFSYELKAGLDLTLTPDTAADEPSREAAFNNLADGGYVFAWRARLADGRWSQAARRVVLIDATPPEPFRVEKVSQDGQGLLVFNAYDKISGVAGYEVKTDESEAFVPAQSPYPVTNNERGPILIRALDGAGNERIAEVGREKRGSFWWLAVVGVVLSGLVLLRFKNLKFKSLNI